MTLPAWTVTTRFDPVGCALADRHYNREKVGTPQFVPPGRCLVLQIPGAIWVTSWPQFVQHAWPGAWINTLFRNESAHRSSDLIRTAVAVTRARWPTPDAGLVTFVDPTAVRPCMRRGRPFVGYCYLKAGFEHVGYTQVRGYWVWQLKPSAMPPPDHGVLTPLFPEAAYE